MRAEDEVVDLVILSGAGETEHHEIAVYENLIIQAEALGHPEVVQLLSQNLEQEHHTLEEVTRATHECARKAAAHFAHAV
jgi:ferritin-like metal-binding protein YciE